MTALRFQRPTPPPAQDLSPGVLILLAEAVERLTAIEKRLAAIEAKYPRELGPMLTVAQVSELLGLSMSKTYELCAMGDIPSRKIGTQVRISRADVLAIMEGSR